MSDHCYRTYVNRKALERLRNEEAAREHQQTQPDDSTTDAEPESAQQRRMTRSLDVSSRNPASKTKNTIVTASSFSDTVSILY